jgi:hypothetical protein
MSCFFLFYIKPIAFVKIKYRNDDWMPGLARHDGKSDSLTFVSGRPMTSSPARLAGGSCFNSGIPFLYTGCMPE